MGEHILEPVGETIVCTGPDGRRSVFPTLARRGACSLPNSGSCSSACRRQAFLYPGRRCAFSSLAAIAALLIALGCDRSEPEVPGTAQVMPAQIGIRQALAEDVEAELLRKLDVWYPRVLDFEQGGYLSNFTHDWQQMDDQEKMIVTQARHVWTLSKVAARYPDRDRYADYAAHGFAFLRDRMWDAEYGGFFQTVTREGEPIPNADGELRKTLYGNAFGVYALAAYYGLSRDPAVLDLARETFMWLENHAHDPVHKGYFQPLARDGSPTTSGYPKDYNSGIHILEALAELFAVWPDPLVRERLSEMFHIVRDTITTEQGYMRLYFASDWTHLSYRDSSEAVIRANIGRDHVTPGHDVETAFLLLEAAHVLGMDEDETTHRIAKRMTDHTMETGFDLEVGGFYDLGYYFKADDYLTIIQDSKNWWAQAEGLHTLMIMADRYPDDPMRYFDAFIRQWEYVKEYLIDHEHGGWFDAGLDKSPERRTARKSHIWKGNYHTVRSLMGALDLLKRS